jgi:hypothetical protein
MFACGFNGQALDGPCGVDWVHSTDDLIHVKLVFRERN